MSNLDIFGAAGGSAVQAEGSLPTITLGFIPLTDCAVLVVARELGFARSEGLELRLSREISWANIRDKVAFGLLDGAQMLAGMPIAISLGINQLRMPMIAPFCLNRNGNAITVSAGLYEEMRAFGAISGDEGPRAVGEALGAVIAGRKERGQAALTFGTVYPFSCHTYELRYWMAACGIDPEADVQLVVVPPPLMVDNLRDGYVDGFCVGEPWNSLAVEAGLGRIVVSKSELWRRGVEKMLCVPHALALEQPEVLAALIRALDRAARWGDDPTNRRQLAELLATPGYLDVPARIVERALSGELVPVRGQPARLVPDFLVLHREGANRPPVDQAQWLYSQMLRWNQAEASLDDESVVSTIFRPDIYEAALAGETWPEAPAPAASAGVSLSEDTFFDGRND